MQFDKRDLAHCENLIKAVKKAKFELDGMEVLALSDVFKWLSGLYSRIQKEATPQEVKPQITAPKEMTSPIAEAPKPLKETKKPKKD